MQLPPNHADLIGRAVELAHQARRHGNHPFGALLATGGGTVVVEAENSVTTDRDPTAHAETNLVRAAYLSHSPDQLAETVLYSSTEPCPMCSGAIFWGGIGGVVFALSQERFYRHLRELDETAGQFVLPAREVLSYPTQPVQVDGPYMEDRALAPHLGFWESEQTREHT